MTAGPKSTLRDPHTARAAAWEPPGTLLGREYCSDEVFDLERRRIFQDGWFCVGRAEEAPENGSFFVTDIAGESVLIVRGEDGLLRGFLNVCRHRGSRLCDGAGRMRVIRCPYHAWSYRLDGRLRSTPNV
jgi:Rieske 2Fe-2S family protein